MSENSNSSQNFLSKIGNAIKKILFSIGHFLKKHKILTSLIVLIMIASIVGINIYRKINSAKNVPVDNSLITTSLSKMDLTSSVSLTGNIASADSRSISTTLVETEIKEVHVSVGDYVNAGDTIITFDSSNLEEELETAEDTAALNNIKNEKSLTDAADAVTQAKENYTNQAAQLQEDVNAALSDYNNLSAKRDEAQAAYQSAQTEVQKAQNNYDAIKEQSENENWAEKVLEKKTALDTAQAEYDKAAAVSDVELTGSIYDALKAAQTDYDSAVASYETPLNDAQAALDAAKQSESQALASYQEYSSQADAAYGAYYGKINTQTETNEKNAEQIEESEYNYNITSLEQSTNRSTQNDQIQEVEEKLGKTVVTSPISGVITAVNVEAGDTYSGGTLFVVQDMEHFIVEGTVDEYDISNISKDLKAVIKTDATDDDELGGIVTFVAPTPDSSASADGTQNVSTTTSASYSIEITLDDYDERLRIGMTAKTSIILESKENVFAVAYDCVETDEEGNSYITVVDDGDNDSQAQSTKKVQVELGMESDYYVEIISDELYEGMKILATASSGDHSSNQFGEMNISLDGGGMPGGGAPGGGGMPGGGF